MICTKCNSIIPDEAKFCPSCGADCKTAPAAQTVSAKKQCEKCGLELEANAKFCPVCGTAASGVSLNKQPNSDSLVSAMPSSVPTPTAASAPSTGTAPYAPPADAMPGGFGEPAPMPQYAPPTGGFGDMGNMGAAGSAAAAVAVPVKKRTGAKVAIIIAAALVVLLAATAIFFFTNKATFLSTFMGKSKYAAMVEGNSVKETAQKIDVSALSDGVKSVSEAYGSLAAVNSTNSIMPTAYDSYASAYGTYNNDSIDIESLINTYAQIIHDNYGTTAIKVTGGAQINLTDSAKTAIGGSDVNTILDIINGTTFTYDLAASENAIGAQLGTSGKLAVDARVLANSDGTCYVAFPFASDKALMFKIDSNSNTEAVSKTVSLELDEKEISRLIEEIIKIYLSHYEKAVTDMGSGSLTVDGTEVSGKLITADFSGGAMTEMMKEIITHIGNDAYFCGKITEFVTECGGELSAAEYKKAFEEAANDVEIPNSAKFSVKTVINNNGDVLAKSYAITANGKMELAYKSGKKDFAAEFIYNVDGDACTFKLTSTENGFTGSLVAESDGDKFTVKADCVKTDSKSGTATITFRENDDGEFRFNISYSGVEKVKSFNREVCVGTVNVTINMPTGFDAIANDLLTVLDGMQITVSNTATTDSQSTNLSVKTTAYGDVSVYATVTATDSGTVLAVPGNVIDLSDAMTGNIDADTQKQLEDFMNEVSKAIQNNDTIKDIMGDFGSVTTPLPGGDVPTIPSPLTPGASHSNDDFSTMSFEELDELFDEYIDRRYDLTTHFGTVEFDSKMTEVNEAYEAAHDYWFDYCYVYDYDDEKTLNDFRNSIRDLVIAVEACEALMD